MSVATRAGAIAFTVMPSLSRHRRKVHDPAPTLEPHGRQRGLRHEEHGFQVHGDQLIPIALGDGFNRLRARDAGVVDQDVDRPKAALNGMDKTRDVVGLRHVGLHDDGLAAERVNVTLNVVRVGLAGVEVHRDVRSCAGERDSRGAADPPARAGDQGDPLAEVGHEKGLEA